MYTINYIEDFVSKEKYGNIFIKVLKILNFFTHIAILVLLVLSFLTYSKTGEIYSKVNSFKKTIEQKRNDNRISEIEQEWESYYYKLLAVRELLEKNTNYGLIFKDLGTYMPQDDYIVNLACKGDNMNVDVYLKNEKLKELNSFYDYSRILNEAFEKSVYLNKDVVVDTIKEDELEKRTVDLLDVKIKVYSRK
jgi:hypothetical protein